MFVKKIFDKAVLFAFILLIWFFLNCKTVEKPAPRSPDRIDLKFDIPVFFTAVSVYHLVGGAWVPFQIPV